MSDPHSERFGDVGFARNGAKDKLTRLTAGTVTLAKHCATTVSNRMVGTAWYDPPLVTAPSYLDRAKTMTLGISDDLTGARTRNFRHTPLFMFWAHIVGELPPINAIQFLADSDPTPTLLTLHDAVACFQGIQRPHLLEDNGDNVLVYVLRPQVTIEFASSMACLARAVQPAIQFALTVQVVLAEALQNCPTNVDGIITRIEAVACDANDRDLPVEYGTRYRRRCW